VQMTNEINTHIGSELFMYRVLPERYASFLYLWVCRPSLV